MSLIHSQITVRGKVTKPESGVVEFDDGKLIVNRPWFRSPGKLKDFELNEPVECIFQVSEKRAYLLKVKSLMANGTRTKVTFEPETVFDSGIHSGIYFDEHYSRAFDLVWRAIEQEHIMLILLRGESGYGKSSYPKAFAEDRGLKFFDINCAAIGDPEEWFGFREAQDGSTSFVLNEFAEAVMEGNCVVNFDEANRIQSYVANTLLPMLDHRRKTTVHKREIVVGPRVIFTMTINEGSKFSGTFNMDAALKNRIDMTLKVGPLKPDIEKQLLMSKYKRLTRQAAAGIVELATQLRQAVKRDSLDVDVSTRTSMKLAALMSLGASFMEAVQFGIQNAAEENDIKPVLDIANQVAAKLNTPEPQEKASMPGGKVIIIETDKPMDNSVKKIDLVSTIRSISGGSIDLTNAKEIVDEAQRKNEDIRLTISDAETFKKAVEILKTKPFKFTTSS